MYCLKCGKEISDDSKFCHNCGLKIDFVKSSENVEKDSISPVNTKSPPNIQDTKEESHVIINQTDLNPPLKTKYLGYGWFGLYFHIKDMISEFIQRQIHLKNEYPGYGWVVLLLFYLYGGSKMDQLYEDYSLIIIFLGFIGILPIYFWFRKFLIKNNFWKGHIGSSSLLSGIVSYILVFILVGGSIGIIGGYQKRIEVNEFRNSFIEQRKNLTKQELEYSKMMMYEPKTKSEINDKILKIDEYKYFLMKKNKHFMSLINFYRGMNSKYKNNKSVDEQITKLEIINRDVLKSSVDSLDLYKKYFITSDEKYFNSHLQEYEKQKPLTDEMTQLMTNIEKSF